MQLSFQNGQKDNPLLCFTAIFVSLARKFRQFFHKALKTGIPKKRIIERAISRALEGKREGWL
jgi:hypothetical protein